MTQQNIEEFLLVLKQLLRMRRSANESIVSELRDHLLERFAELKEQNYSDEEAMTRALREFGDTAALAAQFMQVSRDGRRRRVMRWTFSSLAAACVLIVATLSIWPDSPHWRHNGQAVAEEAGGAAPVANKTDEKKENAAKTAAITAASKTKNVEEMPKDEADLNAPILAKLNQKIEFKFKETPLTEVVNYLKERLETEIQLDQTALEAAGVNADSPVTRNVRCRADMALKLTLRQLNLTYMIQNGVILITSTEEAGNYLVTKIYDVDDLVGPNEEPDSLSNLVSRIVKPTSWDETGGSGTIAMFRNMLVVSNTSEVHEEVASLLKMLRETQAKMNADGVKISSTALKQETKLAKQSRQIAEREKQLAEREKLLVEKERFAAEKEKIAAEAEKLAAPKTDGTSPNQKQMEGIGMF